MWCDYAACYEEEEVRKGHVSICVPFMDVWLVSTVTKSQKQNTSCLLKKNQDYTNCITAPTRDATKSNTWNNKKHIPRVWINHKSASKFIQEIYWVCKHTLKYQLVCGKINCLIMYSRFFFKDDYVLTWTLKVCITISILRTVTKKKKINKRDFMEFMLKLLCRCQWIRLVKSIITA